MRTSTFIPLVGILASLQLEPAYTAALRNLSAVATDAASIEKRGYHASWALANARQRTEYRPVMPPVEEASTGGPSADEGKNGRVPGPTQSRVTEGCGKWHLAVDGDSCYGIARNNGLTLEDFYRWNPDVNQDGECMSLRIGYAYCIGAY
ncbi:hypothetical protein BJ508DRAFT_410891 [Ascobolus immersus RN42]|uniref:LysM domain-containing protein n=1 Tax=Ascobolus immersus RN42 TaxID=1160509 RepID=A0A3N4IKJ2_ASCIM|nr:hypothetical protein BJ508DRAFT_410891 [Ascobolus immersus RN42]